MKRQLLKPNAKKSSLTLLDYYTYRIAVRTLIIYKNDDKYLQKWQFLHHAGKLYQHFIINAWYRVDSNNLNYLSKNQDKLRIAMYSGLMDYIRNQQTSTNFLPGRVRVLPSTYNVNFFSNLIIYSTQIYSFFTRPVNLSTSNSLIGNFLPKFFLPEFIFGKSGNIFKLFLPKILGRKKETILKCLKIKFSTKIFYKFILFFFGLLINEFLLNL